MRKSEENRRQRHSTYYLMILVALAIAAGRIAVVSSSEGDTAFLSANDRSRWCTVACLVERGTYVIDEQIEIRDEVMRNRRPWQTIDKVRHFDPRDGKQHYYSSKPPLLPTLVAFVYFVVSIGTGMTLTEQPIYVARIILAIVNLPLLGLFFYCTIQSIDRVCHSEWTRRVAAASCCFATMVFPFAVSLNNHLPAVAATAAALWLYTFAAERMDDTVDGESRSVPFGIWMAAGLCAAFAAANELPALSMLVFWFILFVWLDRAAMIPFALGVAIIAIGFFGTNWLAHQSLRPAYAHRGNGELIAKLASTAQSPEEMIEEIRRVLKDRGLVSTEEPTIAESDEEGRWLIKAGEQQFALLNVAGSWQLAHWDDWYEYEGTYWKDGVRRGVDRGEPSRLTYLLQMTIGHHGLFSLTPIWLLVPVGLVTGLRFGPSDFRRLALAVLVATVVCFLFYLGRPEIDRNYGGVSVCFRWMLWFAPLWLMLIAPVMQALAVTTERRIVILSMLALSVFSVATSLETPWQSPWIYRFWQFLGWIEA